ncbi:MULTISPECIES: DUF1145 domain-containing protein [Oceanimonas]|uniref:DUF1145 domain-containing protein n=1 Tax=Oceanimonas smirnovii TaxID=264574 RepID=A0ABW7NZS5_9GAMM|nr:MULTISPECIES: DUF1145 domain-containing protein [Oceanimonas]MDV2857779.1 DUF1145 domain-containing protein [Oceanimonas sp. CAM02]
MKVLNLLMRLIMLMFWAGIIYALLGPGFDEAGSTPLILGAVVLVMHILQMVMLKQVSNLLNPSAGDYLEVLVFGSFAMHRHRARLKELTGQQKR